MVIPVPNPGRGGTGSRGPVRLLPPVNDVSDELGGAPLPPDGGGEPSDHDLLRRAQAGDEAGFQGLVERHQERAFRVALNLVMNREDARDLAQDAFLRVFTSLERFDFQHEFTTWLYRIVTNLSIDHLRKRRGALSTASAEEGGDDLELPDRSSDAPWEPMAREETAERVRRIIDRLAPHFRVVMILRELEGLPCTEIARIVGATHVTVRWRLHRGRRLFQEEWEREERLLAQAGGAAGVEKSPNAPAPEPVDPSEDPGGFR